MPSWMKCSILNIAPDPQNGTQQKGELPWTEKESHITSPYVEYTTVNPVPTVTRAPNLVHLLTQDCQRLTGGILDVEKDPVEAANAILAHVEVNRKKLGI